MKRLDHAWILVRRAAGHDQREGVDRRDLRDQLRDRRRAVHRLVLIYRRAGPVAGPAAAEPWGCSTTTGSSRACRDEEVSAQLREQAAERKRQGARASSSRSTCRPTTWPEYPHSVRRQRDHLRRAPRAAPLPRPPRRPSCAPSSPTATASRSAPGRSATAPRSCSARRGADPDGRPRRRARHAVAVVPALPADGPRAPAATPCRSPASAPSRCSPPSTTARGSSRCATPTTRPASCSPIGRAASAARARCPSASSCCSTRRWSTSSTPSRRATPRWRCSTTIPRLLVFRTFSKAWGLAGLRCGYALGGPGSEPLLERLEPELGVNELAQAGALEALRTCGPLVGAGAARRSPSEPACSDRAAPRLGSTPRRSQANVLWLRGSRRRRRRAGAPRRAPRT